MPSQNFYELEELMAQYSALMHAELPRDIMEGLDEKIGQLATRLGENPAQWEGCLQMVYEVIGALMACTEADDAPWESPFHLIVAMYMGRFISHPMCRPIIAKWSEAGWD